MYVVVVIAVLHSMAIGGMQCDNVFLVPAHIAWNNSRAGNLMENPGNLGDPWWVNQRSY